ncbi:MAG: type II toxin-antitoxin system PemK/MazF family toxin [Bacteroides sp.]|nr:type II toxin-antitoxin system PemK/MazF family toxin [Bacteroides sp.]MCM1548820.1 type II toxin-antitoxin system PemK/MazF family toxin [Clostridium sp.]
MEIKRGEIYYADLSPVLGSEQGGVRPVLILQNDMGNQFSPTTIVAAITGRKKTELPTHIFLLSKELPKSSIVLLEQIRTIDKSRIGKYIGKADEKLMQEVDKALAISMGMKTIKWNGKEQTDDEE